MTDEQWKREWYQQTRSSIGSQAHVGRLLGHGRHTIMRRETGKLPIKEEHILALRYLKKLVEHQRGAHLPLVVSVPGDPKSPKKGKYDAF